MVLELVVIHCFQFGAGSGLTFSMNVSPTMILKAISLAKGAWLPICGFNIMQNFRIEMNANPTDMLLTIPSFSTNQPKIVSTSKGRLTQKCANQSGFAPVLYSQ